LTRRKWDSGAREIISEIFSFPPRMERRRQWNNDAVPTISAGARFSLNEKHTFVTRGMKRQQVDIAFYFSNLLIHLHKESLTLECSLQYNITWTNEDFLFEIIIPQDFMKLCESLIHELYLIDIFCYKILDFWFLLSIYRQRSGN